jgi:CheY-like chemotaxis protein
MTATDISQIMYIEDDPDLQEIARLALTEIGGFNVEVFGSGGDALQRAKDIKPDLILLDVMMPDMDGPTTLAELRKLPGYLETPVIFMTAKVQSEEVSKYVGLGALTVIPKPFDPLKLADYLRKLWKTF